MEQAHEDLAVKLRRELHRHPELSGRETWTKAYLIDFLRRHTALEIVDRGRWFYALYRAGADKRNIAFRADFDALPIDETIDLPYGSQYPGVAHKCGHDGHSACLAALGMEIDKHGASQNVYLVFQHAEETLEGALECAPLMDEAHIAEIFAFHNAPGLPEQTIALCDGTACCGSTGMIIHFKGVPAHASQPEDGRNPCFAIAELIGTIPDFTNPALYKGPVLVTVIGMDAGQEAFGMAAGEGRLLLTIRSQFDDDLDALRQNIKRKVKGLAARYGLEYVASFRDSVPAVVNHRESTDKVRRAAKRLGLALWEADTPTRGSEDFAWFLKRTQGGMYAVGAGVDRAPIHTAAFDFNDAVIPTAVDLFRALIDE